MDGPLTDTRFERAIHVMYPSALAALMLAVHAAKERDPEAAIEVAMEEDGPALRLRASDLFPVLRLEMDRRQGKSRDREGGGT